jgi:hypothetical protein
MTAQIKPLAMTYSLIVSVDPGPKEPKGNVERLSVRR